MTIDRPPSHRSPYDGQVHYVKRQVGTFTESLCTHSVPTAEVVPAEHEDEPRCFACALNWGRILTRRLNTPSTSAGGGDCGASAPADPEQPDWCEEHSPRTGPVSNPAGRS